MDERTDQPPIEEPEAEAITENEIDLTVVSPEDRHLKVNVIYRSIGEDEEANDYLGQEVIRFPIRGSLPVPMMTMFLRLETRINNALGADDKDADRELEEVMDEAHRRIVGLIVEQTPQAFRPREVTIEGETFERAKPGIELDVSQILVLLAWVAGDTSVADAVAKALSAGRSTARHEDELEPEAVGAEPRPFGSKPRS